MNDMADWRTDLVSRVAVIIVGFCNVTDIVGCLHALADAQREPEFEVFVAENGGPGAMDSLIAALDGPCLIEAETDFCSDPCLTVRTRQFRLVRADGSIGSRLHVAEMTENLGYAGAINAWLRPLLKLPGWDAVWILNPDTEPAPSALRELADYAKREHKSMVGSCIVATAQPQQVHMRGIAWRRLMAKTLAVDHHVPLAMEPDLDDVEARLDAPSGASLYVTRTLIEQIGLMDERYFLYFEDLDWGVRARQVCRTGYAHRSVVRHKCATTIGRAAGRSASPLAIYLMMRNGIIFVRERYPRWLLWTILMQLVHLARFGLRGSVTTMLAGCRGLVAGIQGEVGRPDRMLKSHKR
jgi:N-acetylglucosaminyl-diphospho-decaprenol L-rhamnosyltransferase